MRGNVPTRLQKVAERGEMDATILALAGLTRLAFTIQTDANFSAKPYRRDYWLPFWIWTKCLPCVGQGAIGIETRASDKHIANICALLNHFPTFQAVTAERAFLRAMVVVVKAPLERTQSSTAKSSHFAPFHFMAQRPDARRDNVRGRCNRPGEELAAKLR